jgi:hypothetical protein
MASISILKVKGKEYQLKDSVARTTKQDLLVSGTNIKTINGISIMGSGDIEIKGGDLCVPKRLNSLSIISPTSDRSKAYLYLDNAGTDSKISVSGLLDTKIRTVDKVPTDLQKKEYIFLKLEDK